MKSNVLRFVSILSSTLLITACDNPPPGTAFDTDEDGTSDLLVNRENRDGAAGDEWIHFDTNKNGRVDDGETVIGNALRYRSKPLLEGGKVSGYEFRIQIPAGPGTQFTERVIRIKDKNGDGDTADDGEVEE